MNDIVTTTADQLPTTATVSIDEAIRRDLDAYFRFEIGDLVIERCRAEAIKLGHAINGPVRAYDRVAVEIGMTVLQRRLEQCHGGVQGFYAVRRYNENGQEVTVMYIEHELVAWSDIESALRAAVPEKKS